MLMIGKVSRPYGPEAAGKNRAKKGYSAEGLSGESDRADCPGFWTFNSHGRRTCATGSRRSLMRFRTRRIP